LGKETTGNKALKVNVDNTGIEIDSDALRLKDAGVTGAKLAAAVAGDGLGKETTGNKALKVNVDDDGIEIDSDALRLKDAGVKAAKLNADVVGLGLEQDTSTKKLKIAIPGDGAAHDGKVMTLEHNSGTGKNSIVWKRVSVVNVNDQAAYTLKNNDRTAFIRPTTKTAVTITLPASPNAGQIHTIKRMGVVANKTIDVVPPSGYTIDGTNSIDLNVDYQRVTLQFTGHNKEWAVIAD